jgi:sulfur carrier protein
MITIRREPGGATLQFERLNTVRQLLHRLDEKVNSVLVIRQGRLLTPDLHLKDGDEIVVRSVRSSG